MQYRFYSRYGKRFFDLVLTIPGLVVMFPVLAVVAVLVRMKLGSAVLFRQLRPGVDGKTFMMYKFRTMTDKRDAEGNLLPDDERLTRFGRFLRASSLDELPELWNVVKGDMSLVGPRPLRMEYLPLYSKKQFRRHEVPPGITGWAQVNGRNAITWENKFKLDVWYVDNCTLLTDIKIFVLTFIKILKREGINAGEDISMPKFTGTGNKT